ncbi:type II toxin-antitoxin system HicB family antitoxin [Clostridium tunisiense]|uniref:type II toxin-antitoxin system HicB family antitoxin n=1 Tax=Clostridium tunisiense TaxID=219748 RepID=UPI0002E94796|nr:type II toxin-antitoxin system HicB family antitoxin [Clostridium tunisiense]
MDKYMFPAVFEQGEKEGYCITFPDLPGCITEGKTLEEGIVMAKEVLELWIWSMEEDNESIPEATKPENIQIEKGSFVVPVLVNMVPVREEMNNKSVNKTVTLPYWMKKIAEENKVNFSQILQRGIIEHLNLSRKI